MVKYRQIIQQRSRTAMDGWAGKTNTAEEGQKMKCYIQYKISGAEEEHVETVEVDHISLVRNVFLMKYYLPDGRLGEGPGPDWVKVYAGRPSAESVPYEEWHASPSLEEQLDEIQQEAEKLLALLKDRQPGLSTWNEFMQERLQSLHGLISQVLGKETIVFEDDTSGNQTARRGQNPKKPHWWNAI